MNSEKKAKCSKCESTNWKRLKFNSICLSCKHVWWNRPDNKRKWTAVPKKIFRELDEIGFFDDLGSGYRIITT